jgi:undecaprenyl-diphosphatase
MFEGLRSPALFTRRPALGLAMFLAGGLIVALLAYLLGTNDAFLQWDQAVAKTFRSIQSNAPWTWMENMLFGTFLGREVAVIFGTVLALYFFHKRFWRELALVGIGLGGGALIGIGLGLLFDRPRPADHLEVLMPSGPSFPSVSALIAVLCYGLLAYLLVPQLSSRIWKGVVILLCTLAILVVALSSLLFGTHYVSDVIAGTALGLAWAGLAFTLVERFFPLERASGRLVFQGLRSSGFFKRNRWPGIILLLLSSLLFTAVAYGVQAKGNLIQIDQTVYRAMLATAREASPVVQDLMLFGFFLGKQSIQLIVLGLSLYFLWQRYWLELAILQISTQGGGLLKNLIMDHISRPRPPEQMGLVITTLSSFPSGHTLGTMICYGFLAYLLIPKMPSPFWKWTLGLGILLLMLFEGLSRVFHGNHYLTDVLAGYLLGMAWLILVCLLMENFFIKRDEAKVQQKGN